MSLFITPHFSFIGKGALEQSAQKIKECGSKALIVTGKHVVKSDAMKALTGLLDSIKVSYSVFDGITGEPTDKMIESGVAQFRSNSCDFCIGIGGGSPLDSAKAIVTMAVSDGSINDFCGKEIAGDISPVVAIPTTAGTGSEATKFTIITNTESQVKMLLKGDCLVPHIAVVDPSFSVSCPQSITAATGMDALTHAVESYTSKKATAMTDVLALSAVKRIMKNLKTAYNNPEDSEAREQMSVAAYEAGICINNASVTLIHGLSRPIGANFHIAHGISNAILLKAGLFFALDGAYDRFAQLGRATGAATDSESDKDAAEKFLSSIGTLCSDINIGTLSSLGVDKEEFLSKIDKMSEDAIASGSPANTIKAVTKEDCKVIYRQLF